MPEAEDGQTDEEQERSARPFWSGTLSFGLVSIPVALFPATRNVNASLRMLDSDGTPLVRRYYCPADGKDVDAEHLVRGYELAEGEYVPLTDEELASLDPKKSRDIDLRLFVDEGSIDPLYFERAYFLAPSGDSQKAYRLLVDTMRRTGRAGIASFVLRDTEHLVAIFADGEVLRAETLRWNDEVRRPNQVGLSKKSDVRKATVQRFERAIAANSARALPTADLHDDRHQALAKLAREKYRRGVDVVKSEAAPEATRGADVIDLLEVLKRSLKGKTASTEKPPHRRDGRTRRKAHARRGK